MMLPEELTPEAINQMAKELEQLSQNLPTNDSDPRLVMKGIDPLRGLRLFLVYPKSFYALCDQDEVNEHELSLIWMLGEQLLNLIQQKFGSQVHDVLVAGQMDEELLISVYETLMQEHPRSIPLLFTESGEQLYLDAGQLHRMNDDPYDGIAYQRNGKSVSIMHGRFIPQEGDCLSLFASKPSTLEVDLTQRLVHTRKGLDMENAEPASNQEVVGADVKFFIVTDGDNYIQVELDHHTGCFVGVLDQRVYDTKAIRSDDGRTYQLNGDQLEVDSTVDQVNESIRIEACAEIDRAFKEDADRKQAEFDRKKKLEEEKQEALRQEQLQKQADADRAEEARKEKARLEALAEEASRAEKAAAEERQQKLNLIKIHYKNKLAQEVEIDPCDQYGAISDITAFESLIYGDLESTRGYPIIGAHNLSEASPVWICQDPNKEQPHHEPIALKQGTTDKYYKPRPNKEGRKERGDPMTDEVKVLCERCDQNGEKLIAGAEPVEVLRSQLRTAGNRAVVGEHLLDSPVPIFLAKGDNEGETVPMPSAQIGDSGDWVRPHPNAFGMKIRAALAPKGLPTDSSDEKNESEKAMEPANPGEAPLDLGGEEEFDLSDLTDSADGSAEQTPTVEPTVVPVPGSDPDARDGKTEIVATKDPAVGVSDESGSKSDSTPPADEVGGGESAEDSRDSAPPEGAGNSASGGGEGVSPPADGGGDTESDSSNRIQVCSVVLADNQRDVTEYGEITPINPKLLKGRNDETYVSLSENKRKFVVQSTESRMVPPYEVMFMKTTAEGGLVTWYGPEAIHPDNNPEPAPFYKRWGTAVASKVQQNRAASAGIAVLVLLLLSFGGYKLFSSNNQAPTIASLSASADSAPAGTEVKLTANEVKDEDGDNLTYSWEQTKGPEVVLTNPDKLEASFTSPEVTADTALEFKFTTNDGHEHPVSQTVAFTAKPKAAGTGTPPAPTVPPRAAPLQSPWQTPEAVAAFNRLKDQNLKNAEGQPIWINEIPEDRVLTLERMVTFGWITQAQLDQYRNGDASQKASAETVINNALSARIDISTIGIDSQTKQIRSMWSFRSNVVNQGRQAILHGRDNMVLHKQRIKFLQVNTTENRTLNAQTNPVSNFRNFRIQVVNGKIAFVVDAETAPGVNVMQVPAFYEYYEIPDPNPPGAP